MIKIFILLFSLAVVSGQSLNNNSLKNSLLKKSGLTEEQARKLAKQSGLTTDPGFDLNISKPDISIDKKNIKKTQR